MSLLTEVEVPWDPIDPYAELRVRLQVLRPEHKAVLALRDRFDEHRHSTSKFAMDQATVWRRLNEEMNFLDKILQCTCEDMWDHRSLSKLECRHLSRKRKAHMRQAIPHADEKERRSWLYARMPPDALAERREKARERWRKAAYLLGILCFWRHVASAPGSKASRAALARLAKRAREA